MFRTKCKEHDHSSFYQFLQMEHSHKNTDCYFFYYSTCKKGDNCPFRHEPSALGCETMCTYWQQGNCLNENCNYRHMELKKNRKLIPCYWETQPSGCRKPHCSFLHKNARTITSDPINPVEAAELSSKPINQEWLDCQGKNETKYDCSSTESDQGRGSREAGSFIGSPAVDPLIVKFEKESDNESVPSPVKPQQQASRVPYCKTYEEIRLEEIQAESAAYYSYEADDYQGEVGGGKAKRVATSRASRKVCLYKRSEDKKKEEEEGVVLMKTASDGLDFEVLSLEEIRRRKRRKAMEASGSDAIKIIVGAQDEEEEDEEEDGKQDAEEDTKQDAAQDTTESSADFLKDAIKTLAELRASTGSKGVKRPFEECGGDETEQRKMRTRVADDSGSGSGGLLMRKVPPVRLRRSPKRLAVREVGERRNDPQAEKRDQGREEQGRDGERRCERLLMSERRAEEAGGKEESRDAEESMSSVSRKSEVEIRLCDSSTDEDQMRVEAAFDDERSFLESDATYESKNAHVSSGTLLGINEVEYLMLDTASDDILKDIDAILKDKPTI